MDSPLFWTAQVRPSRTFLYLYRRTTREVVRADTLRNFLVQHQKCQQEAGTQSSIARSSFCFVHRPYEGSISNQDCILGKPRDSSSPCLAGFPSPRWSFELLRSMCDGRHAYQNLRRRYPRPPPACSRLCVHLSPSVFPRPGPITLSNSRSDEEKGKRTSLQESMPLFLNHIGATRAHRGCRTQSSLSASIFIWVCNTFFRFLT